MNLREDEANIFLELIQESQKEESSASRQEEKVPDWMKVFLELKRSQEKSTPTGNDREESTLESEKEKLLREIHAATNEYAMVKKEKDELAESVKDLEEGLQKYETYQAKIEKISNKNFVLLEKLKITLKNLTEEIIPTLRRELEYRFQGQSLLLKAQFEQKEAIMNKFKIIQEQEVDDIQLSVLKEIRIRDLDSEIIQFTQQAHLLNEKIQNEKEEVEFLQEIDKKQAKELRSTIDCTRNAVKMYKKLNLPNAEFN